jgi:uncharacterized membrane protein
MNYVSTVTGLLVLSVIVVIAYPLYQIHRADTWTRDQHNYDREFNIMRNHYWETA